MKTSFPKNLALLSTVVLGASFFAYAQLGGAGGVVFAYQGYLERDGTPMNEAVDITVEVYSQANGGAVCDSDVSAGVLVSSGTFGIEVGPIDEDCVLDESVYLEVLVQGTPDGAPVRVTGRTQVHPTLQAYTGAAGDFDVPEQLSAGSVITGSLGSAAQPVATGRITALTSTTGAITTVTSTTVNSGRLNATGGGTGLLVNNNATVSGTLTATNINVTSSLTFPNSGCPTGTSRMGSWCITGNRGSASIGNAINNCDAIDMQVCPLEAIVHCDQRNFGACGTLTDEADPDGPGFASSTTILTSTIAVHDVVLNESAFDNATCYFSRWEQNPVIDWTNGIVTCGSGEAYFCCSAAR